MNEWTLCIKDLQIPMYLGAYPHEHKKIRSILVQIKCELLMNKPNNHTNIKSIVCYEKIVYNILERFKNSHVTFAETLAQGIADICLEDERIHRVWIKIEKEAGVSHTKSVGVEILRSRAKKEKI